MYCTFPPYLMSVFAAVWLICIIHGICISPDMANELWKCVVFYVYMERLVFSSCQIPLWNMSGSAWPVIEAHWSISQRCLHEFGKQGGEKKQIFDLLALDRHKQSAIFTGFLNSSVQTQTYNYPSNTEYVFLIFPFFSVFFPRLLALDETRQSVTQLSNSISRFLH